MNSFITNIGQLVSHPGTGPAAGKEMGRLNISKNKTIELENGEIKRIEDDSAFKGLDKDRSDVIDAESKPVLPGFVDPHTHFVFSGYRSEEFKARLQGKSYEQIAAEGGGILNSVNSTRAAPYSKLKAESKERLVSMVRHGVTSLEGKTGYGLNKKTELEQLRVMLELDAETPLDISPTFLGAHAVPEEYSGRREAYVNYLVDELIPLAAQEGAKFCDVFCDEGAFSTEESRRILNRGKQANLIPKIHADEIKRTGGAELASEVEAISAEHLLKSSKRGLEMMKEQGVIPVLLPMTAFSLKKEYAGARQMVDMGLPVSLATDINPGSCFSESIPLLFSLATINMNLTVNEAITALTLNAAAAIGREDEVGSIEPGKKCDLIILDAPSYDHLIYHTGVNIVERVVKSGKVIWSRDSPAL